MPINKPYGMGEDRGMFPKLVPKGKIAWKLSYLKTFDMKKLSKKIPHILNRTILDLGKRSAEASVENLVKMRSPKLADFTKKMREKKIGWGGKKVESSVSGNQPLYQTGNLRKNVRWNENTKSLEMPEYGAIQHKGFTSQIKRRYMNYKYIDVPPRKFIALPQKLIFKRHGGNYIADSKPMRRGVVVRLRRNLIKRARLHARSTNRNRYTPILR